MSLFPVSIMTLFWKQNIGMSMTEILSVQALFGLVMALFEFPSGYLADRIGYRRTLIVSSVLGCCGWSLYTQASDITGVISAEAILGISVAMASGCDSALLYASLTDMNEESTFARWIGRVRFVGQGAEGSAALVAGALFIWAPWAPFAAQAMASLCGLFISIALREPTRNRPIRSNHLQQVAQMVRYAFIQNRRLAAVITLTIVLGMASFVPVWLIPLYATDAGLAAKWVGPMWAVANYSVALGSLYSHRIAGRLGMMPTLLACVALMALGYGGLALSYGLYGFAWYFCITVMRGVFGPVLHHEENRLIPSAERAGFLSMRSLLFRLVFFVVGPVVGLAVDAYGQHAVISMLGVILCGLALMAWSWLRKTLRV